MAVLLTWGGKTLSVSPTSIYSFNDLTFGGTVKTKEVQQNGINKSEADGLQPVSYSCSVPLDARLGIDVQGELSSWMALMRGMCRSRLLIAGKDIFGVSFMLTKCEAKNVRLRGDGTWLLATMELEFTECAEAQAATQSTSSSSKSKKSSSSKKSTKSKVTSDVDVVSGAAPSTSGGSGKLTGLMGGYTAVKAVVNTAKTVSSVVDAVKNKLTTTNKR